MLDGDLRIANALIAYAVLLQRIADLLPRVRQ